jgi:hypothetical protein
VGVPLTEGLDHTFHEAPLGCFIGDLEAVLDIEALCGRVDPENAKAYWLLHLERLLYDGAKQVGTNALTSELRQEVELFKLNMRGVLFDGDDASNGGASNNNLVRLRLERLAVILSLFFRNPCSPSGLDIRAHCGFGDAERKRFVAGGCLAQV